MRLSEGERRELPRRAGSLPLSAYIKAQLFGTAPGSYARRVPAEQSLLAQVLGKLGQAELAASLSRLSRASELGNLYVDELTAQRLREACADVRDMQRLLMQALRVPLPTPREDGTVRHTFRAAALDRGEGE